MAHEATVFDVQRFSLHDGPGIRTVVFFKGCSLACTWCQNPESLRRPAEVAFYSECCTDCGDCSQACPQGAVITDPSTYIDWSACDHCGRCVETCATDALRLVGRAYTVDSLLEVCLRDQAFARVSHGGVTLSGGEPVLSSRFLGELLPRLRSSDVHVLLETAGHYPWVMLEPLLAHLDHIYFDWKVPEISDYSACTGGDGRRVADNLTRLMRSSMPLTVRTPLVPGVCSTPDQLETLARTLLGLGVVEVSLLPYNHLWEAKLSRLDTTRRPAGIREVLTPEDAAPILQDAGMTVLPI